MSTSCRRTRSTACCIGARSGRFAGGAPRSTDGGATFVRVLYANPDTGAVDVVLDPRDPHTVYAALWAARQAPWEIGSSFERPDAGTGLFKSTDGGTTWKRLEGGLPTQAQAIGRVGIAIATSDPARVYAMADSPSAGVLYRSDDAGATWTRVNHEERVYGRGNDFAGVAVDPHDRDVVWVANTSMYRSSDGGRSFTAVRGAPGATTTTRCGSRRTIRARSCSAAIKAR